MSRVLRGILGLLLVGVPVVDCAAGGNLVQVSEQRLREIDPQERILWGGPAQDIPEFLPQSIVLGQELKDLPIDGIEKAALREEIRGQKERGSCSEAEVAVQGSGSEVFTLAQLLARYGSVARGSIVAISPGWDVRHRQPAEAVYIVVDDVYFQRTADAAPAAGSIVGLVVSGGDVLIDGLQICKDRQPGTYEPTLGDDVLIAGNVSPDDSHFFRNSAIFPLVGGEVLAQPMRSLRADQHAIDVDELRRILREADSSAEVVP